METVTNNLELQYKGPVTGQYLQYGCGWCAPIDWMNYDASPTLLFERLPLIGAFSIKNGARFPPNVKYGDIVRGLPVATNSCKGIYCSHILEHLALEDCDRALINTFKYLQPGGLFRLVVPDLEDLARRYLNDGTSAAAHKFMEDSCLGQKSRPRRLYGFIKELLGNSAHRWMWDIHSLSARLSGHGFQAIRRCKFGDASDPMFSLVEDPKRFESALAIECGKGHSSM